MSSEIDRMSLVPEGRNERSSPVPPSAETGGCSTDDLAQQIHTPDTSAVNQGELSEPSAPSTVLPSGPYGEHPYAKLFPMMQGEARQALIEDVRQFGVHEPLVMLKGLMLDGRNRYHAARETGQPFQVVEYKGSDPLAFVLSRNLHRRHLDTSQRAMVAAGIANMEQGRPAKTPSIAGVSQDAAAKMLNVSVASVERAAAVMSHGTPELTSSVVNGQVSVAAASEVAKLPREIQEEVLGAGPKVVPEVAAELRQAGWGASAPEEAIPRFTAIARDVIRNRGNDRSTASPGGKANKSGARSSPASKFVRSCRGIVALVNGIGAEELAAEVASGPHGEANLEIARAAYGTIKRFLDASDAGLAAAQDGR